MKTGTLGLSLELETGDANSNADISPQEESQNASVGLGVAVELRARGLFKDAEEAYREVLFQDRNCADAWLGLGQCARARGDRRLALTYFQAGALAQPSNPWPILEAAEELLDCLLYTSRCV